MRTRRLITIGGGVLLLLVLLLTFTYQRDIRSARKRVSQGSRMAETRCGPIEYAAAGTGSPVLMIHGAGGGFDQGLDMARPLAENGFQVIAMSRFGYLRTPLPSDASPQAQADAHLCLLDTLGVRKATVIGGSAGAPSAIQFCLRYPERCSALVLAVPITFAPRFASNSAPQRGPVIQFLVTRALQSDFAYWAATKLARNMVYENILATPAADVGRASTNEQQRVQHIMQTILPLSVRATGIQNDMTIAATLPPYDLEKVSVPTLIISVQDDRFGTFERASYTAEHIKGARFVSYPQGGHLWVGHQRDVWTQIVRFVRGTNSL